ncbi:hypothetical protein [Stenotrophomonas sp. PS02289]|uniref:hypothetical protein n=1 Tax=Stenotrophomonas sp. PS02289 TaxID=2991422 RepID=UPI00249AF326|nr:hypothetical protein [Stenotrophomonas sp. PS02289]
MKISGMFTTFIGALAAFQGARAAPTTPPGSTSTDLTLTDISNGRMPTDLVAALQRNYGACEQRLGQNPRITDAMTEEAKRAVCMAQAGMGTAFEESLKSTMPGDTPLIRTMLHRLFEGRAENPIGDIDPAGYSPETLLRINFNDYKESQTSYYANNLAEQVEFLARHIPEQARGSLADARRAFNQPACRKAWAQTSGKWVRAEISKRLVFADMRGVLKPESMDRTQIQELKADLEDMQFGNSALKRRMLHDALTELVRQHHEVAVVPTP